MNADAASARTQPAMRLETPLSGRALALARAGWVVLVALALAIFALSLPARFAQVNEPDTATDIIWRGSNLSMGVLAAYLTALTAVFGLGCFIVAALIVRGKSDNLMALFVSFFLVLLGSANAPNMQALIEANPTLTLPVTLIMLCTWTAVILFLLLFPNGRFVPWWTRPLFVVWMCGFTASLAVTGDSLNDPQSAIVGLMILCSLIAGAGIQIYRFIRTSTASQRQQTKWVIFGIVTAIVVQVGAVMLEPFFLGSTRSSGYYDAVEVTLVTLGYLAIPATIGIAVLRHQLWDIDTIINRALVYGLLTASIAGVYVLVIGGISLLLQPYGNLVVSLLAAGMVAVLFQPLRERLQRGVNRLMYGERDEPYAVLSRLSRRLEATIAPDTVLPTVVQTVREALKLPYAAITLNQNGEFNVVAESGARKQNPRRIPLSYQGEPVGELLLSARPGEDAFGDADLRLLNDLARQAGIAAHGVRLTADLQRSRERLVTAREEERRRLRRDLHDGLGPQLASQTLTIDAAVKLMKDDPQAAADLLQDLKVQSQAAVADIRRLVYGLRPPALDDLGLPGALQALAATYRHSQPETSIAIPQPLAPLPAAVEVACYRIVQEALANAVRHSNASTCSVSLLVDDSTLVIEICDDGDGLPSDHHSGVGLHSMRERAAELGGSCLIQSRSPGGVCVTARLPLSTEE